MMSSPRKVLIKPIIISHDSKMLIPSQKLRSGVHFSKIKIPNIHVYSEEVIYESKNCDFLKGESQEVKIINKVNLVNKSCRTIAKFTRKGVTVETTSDDVCSLIGQKNYDTVLSALSSIFNEETKVRGILSLLKPQTQRNSNSTQADLRKSEVDAASQTAESIINHFSRLKKRKRLRKCQFSTYVVKDSPQQLTKCVINIDDVKKEPKTEVKEVDPLPHLNLDEDSNLSIGSMSSLPSLPGALDRTEELLSAVEKATVKEKSVNSTVIKVLDGSLIMIPIKPEDHFHIATPEILKHVTKEERRKLLQYQAYIDSKMCTEQDEDGYYPLHVAVLNSEAELVRRQCFALRARRESVDILAGGMTALHMAIRQNAPDACINGLLYFGADPLLCDADGRTSLHHCAGATICTLRCVVTYCEKHARRLLQNNGKFWKPELESKSDWQLAEYLFEKFAEMFDDQGYTPLMLAAGLAQHEHVSLLVLRAPRLVDVPARSSGDTALYRAVAAACLHARDSNNRSVVPEKFLKTVETLVENGADPSIENHSGSSVNTLLTEFNICSLSMAVANKMNALTHRKFANHMILYKSEGRIGHKNINDLKETKNKELKANLDVAKDIMKKIPGLHAIITVNAPPNKVTKTAKVIKNVKLPDLKKIVRNIPIAPKVKTDVKLKTVKSIAGVKIMKSTKELLSKDNFKDDRNKQDADKVTIVENVKVDVWPKLTAATAVTTVASKPKNIVISPVAKMKLAQKQSLMKMVRKSNAVDESNSKKRKLD